MNNSYHIDPIGSVKTSNGIFTLEIESKFRAALLELTGFSHLNIIWWANFSDTPGQRDILTAKKPYKKGPDKIGIFATRSPIRPNPIMLSTVFVLNINFEKGIIETSYIDAEDGTPILDIKPYHPCSDKIRDVSVPDWCKHFPKCWEDSGTFKWEDEFNF